MASGNGAVQRGESSGPGRPSSGASAGGPRQDLRWIPIAIGAAALVAGLGGRKKGGAAAVGAVRGVQPGRGQAGGKRQGASGGKLEVERSITIGKTADELRHIWLDPRTLPQIMAGFATVRATGEGRMHWRVEGPLGARPRLGMGLRDRGPAR
jgi:uncharacterized membrane protein